MKRKHYDEIVAWAEGKQIQFRNDSSKPWQDIECPTWWPEAEYRVKPVVAQYRVALINMGANRFDTAIVKSAEDELRAAANHTFVRWLTDRVEVSE